MKELLDIVSYTMVVSVVVVAITFMLVSTTSLVRKWFGELAMYIYIVLLMMISYFFVMFGMINI